MPHGCLVHGVRAPLFPLLVLAGANRKDRGRAVAGADDRVGDIRRAMHEVPLPQRPLVALDDQERLPAQHEEVLLVGLPVVHRHRIARAEHEDVEPDLRELRLSFEVADRAARPAVEPPGIVRVEDVPAVGSRDGAVLGLIEWGFAGHASVD